MNNDFDLEDSEQSNTPTLNHLFTDPGWQQWEYCALQSGQKEVKYEEKWLHGGILAYFYVTNMTST
jgi:hypothetical protein